jgi:hypothetical protein
MWSHHANSDPIDADSIAKCKKINAAATNGINLSVKCREFRGLSMLAMMAKPLAAPRRSVRAGQSPLILFDQSLCCVLNIKGLFRARSGGISERGLQI